MILNAKQIQELEEASKPLVEFLRSNFNPHVTVIVTGQSAEMVEGLATVMPFGDLHASDCAVHNEPAYPAGPCDCGATVR